MTASTPRNRGGARKVAPPYFLRGRPPASWCVRVEYKCEYDGVTVHRFGIYTYEGASNELWTEPFLAFDPDRPRTALMTCPSCGRDYQRSESHVRDDLGPIEPWDRRSVSKSISERGVS